MEVSTEISQKIRSAIKAKLMELGAYVDDELPDYIMVMVANKKSRSQMSSDLCLFLGTNTDAFTGWLHGLLGKLQTITVESSDKLKTKATKERKKDKKEGKDKKKSKKHNSESSSKKKNETSDKNESSSVQLKPLALDKDEVETNIDPDKDINLKSKPQIESDSIELPHESSKEVDVNKTTQSHSIMQEDVEDVRQLLVTGAQADELAEELETTEEEVKKSVSEDSKVLKLIGSNKPSAKVISAPSERRSRSPTPDKPNDHLPAVNRKRKIPTSVVAHVSKKSDNDEEEYDPYNPAVGSVASVVKVTSRRSSVPASLQANRKRKERKQQANSPLNVISAEVGESLGTGFQTPVAKRMAVSRALMKLPRSPKKYAAVFDGLTQICSPRKKIEAVSAIHTEIHMAVSACMMKYVALGRCSNFRNKMCNLSQILKTLWMSVPYAQIQRATDTKNSTEGDGQPQLKMFKASESVSLGDIKQVLEDVIKSSQENNDDISLFSKMVESSLRKLKAHQLPLAKLQIQQVLYAFETNNGPVESVDAAADTLTDKDSMVETPEPKNSDLTSCNTSSQRQTLTAFSTLKALDHLQTKKCNAKYVYSLSKLDKGNGSTKLPADKTSPPVNNQPKTLSHDSERHLTEDTVPQSPVSSSKMDAGSPCSVHSCPPSSTSGSDSLALRRCIVSTSTQSPLSFRGSKLADSKPLAGTSNSSDQSIAAIIVDSIHKKSRTEPSEPVSVLRQCGTRTKAPLGALPVDSEEEPPRINPEALKVLAKNLKVTVINKRAIQKSDQSSSDESSSDESDDDETSDEEEVNNSAVQDGTKKLETEATADYDKDNQNSI
ncbi:zinc finger CCCH domain-containing protein 14 [Biomphalaria glabrata]|nr:zinc finger CCCH domain-containing protein 14 [Biomphalaria glabrata]